MDFLQSRKNNYGHLLSNYISFTSCRDVAQSGRALRSGRRSRAFKSRHPDHSKTIIPKYKHIQLNCYQSSNRIGPSDFDMFSISDLVPKFILELSSINQQQPKPS